MRRALMIMASASAYLGGIYRRVDARMAPQRKIRIGRERLRQILKAHKIMFQRTRTRTRTRKEPTT